MLIVKPQSIIRPLHNTKEEEFETFAAAYNASGIRFFTEDRANLRYGKHGASHQRYLKVQMALASFHAELFGN